MSNLNWGIVGTGWIGSEMAEALWAVHGTVYGVCGSSLEKAENFAKEYKIEHAYNDLDEMLSDKNIHIVYIATPHNMHYEMMLKSKGRKACILWKGNYGKQQTVRRMRQGGKEK